MLPLFTMTHFMLVVNFVPVGPIKKLLNLATRI